MCTEGKKTCKTSAFNNFICALCSMCWPLCACTHADINNIPVSELDLNRYLGSWYELARFDHPFERGLSACTANYSIREDGDIGVENKGLKNGEFKISEGRAKTTNTIGLLRVSFFGPFYSDYRVLKVADDYSYALVGSASDRYLWILSRTPELPDANIQMLLQEAVHRGYDISKLIWVDQSYYIQ